MKQNIKSDSKTLEKPKFERKRTANLESLIGNLKVRKLNQNPNSPSKRDTKMQSLYVEVTNSLSDCSRSTPPLSSSSPSVSPSSISPDSPIQSNVSSSLSSISPSSLATASNFNSNKSRSLLPKFRWMMESSSSPPQQSLNNSNVVCKEEEEDEEFNENSTLSPSSYTKYADQESDHVKETINNISSLSWTSNEPIQIKKPPQTPKPQTQHKITAKQLKEAKPQPEQLFNAEGLNYKMSTNTKPNEDPSRAVKFYDDFIDFRGDILRRPPNSKNCRILWEYLFLLLQDNNYQTVIKWEDPIKMVFRIVQAEKLAALWGLQKNRLGMTYEKLSRGMRYYYPNNIIAREPGRRLLYRFMRHPDEIKKFVKKNGTYMLKKAKISGKKEDKGDANPDDSGVDEPVSMLGKNKDIAGDELDEEFNEEIDPEGMGTDANQESDEMEESNEVKRSTSPQSFNQAVVNDKNNQLNTTAQNTNQFYSDLYQYMYSAQMAAAAMGLPAHAYFSRLMSTPGSNNDEANAAQYLMQLRNQTEAGQVDSSQNQFLNESLQNLASTMNNTLNNTTKNSNNQNDLYLKSKRSSKSNSSTSSYSSSSSTHSLESEFMNHNHHQGNDLEAMQNKTSNNCNIKSSLVVVASNNELNNYPLNLSISSNNGNGNKGVLNRKRKSKYDISKFEDQN